MNCIVSIKRSALKEASSKITIKASDDPTAYAQELIKALQLLTSSSDTGLAAGASLLVSKLGNKVIL